VSAEYSGKMDADKTVHVLPRPLTRVQDRIRALNLTGDETGNLPTDNLFFWQGLDKLQMAALDAGLATRLLLEQEIDALWYD
jgi:hypothetical protein